MHVEFSTFSKDGAFWLRMLLTSFIPQMWANRSHSRVPTQIVPPLAMGALAIRTLMLEAMRPLRLTNTSRSIVRKLVVATLMALPLSHTAIPQWEAVNSLYS